jgi:hypothetical protein
MMLEDGGKREKKRCAKVKGSERAPTPFCGSSPPATAKIGSPEDIAPHIVHHPTLGSRSLARGRDSDVEEGGPDSFSRV